MNEKFIGDRLTALRIKKGVSEQRMSYDLGNAKTYVWNIAQHKSSPSMGAFLDICEYLNITPAQFFEPLLTSSMHEHIKQYASLSEEDRQVVDRIMYCFIEERKRKENNAE